MTPPKELSKLKTKRFLFGTSTTKGIMETKAERFKLAVDLLTHPDPRVIELVNHLRDPRFDSTSVVTICQKVGLQYPQLVKIFKDVKMTQGLIRMYDHVPQVMEDVAIDAQSSLIPCRECEGVGHITLKEPVHDLDDPTKIASYDIREKECLNCEGVGKVRKMGDQDSRKMVFEAIGLVSKRGPTVNIQNNNGGGNDQMEDILAAMSKPKAALPVAEAEFSPLPQDAASPKEAPAGEIPAE